VNEPRDADSVAARLRSLRGTLGLSQEQLARRLGVSFASVNRWESGRTEPSAKAVAALAGLEAELAAGGTRIGGGDPLPVAQSSFVGRSRELAELTRLIGQSRLVTLIGPGGAGKTRLAAEVLSRNVAHADIVFVPLEQISYPRSLTSALASQLQVPDQHGKSLLESLRSALAAAPKVLLLDGAEQIAAQVAELAGDLLAAVPEVRLVVTSRVLLGIPGEVCWAVPPLDCPSVAAGASDIAASDAVQLFITRATERLPDFRPADVAPHAIAELCRRLDGLPLAIELIAGWVGTLSIREILQQRAVLLDSEPAQLGQHSGRRLADVLKVSYDLLTPEQQRRLAALSVLAGSFRIADVQAVLDLDAPAAVATTRLLVDSSWLVVTRGSEQNLFSMLETIRTFAALQLEQDGDGPAARRRHALHFAAIATGSEQGLAGPDAADWASRLRAAVADLHAALHWAGEHADVDLGLDISAALWRWWLVSGRLAVGRNWLARFLALAGPREDELAGRALCSAAVLAAENGDYAGAIESAERALAIFGTLGLKLRMTLAATVLGSAHRYLGNHESARRGFQLAMDLRAELGDRRGMSVAINNMALLELDDGNFGRARELFEQALAIKREFGEQRSIAISLANLADVLIRTSQWEAADDALREAAAMAVDDQQLIGTIRCNQGAAAARRQDWAEAIGYFRAAIEALQAGGHPHSLAEAMIGLGRACDQAGDHDEALRQLRAAQALAAETGNLQRAAEAEAALAELTGSSAGGRRDPGLQGAGPQGAGLQGAGPQGAGPQGAGPQGAGPQGAKPLGAKPQGAGPQPGNLTGRQAEVLRLLAAGLSNKQIAAELFISTATVERHLATIYRNLGLAGRVEAARFAINHGIADRASVS
jgi:predicted ATPase/DNA-binding CsgD family transcriptional regulator/DNA-binding XRE family transcriptional regulator